jgi:hypothetical protein
MRQQRRRVEDAAPHAFGPVLLDEANQPQLVDIRVSGRGRVEEENPTGPVRGENVWPSIQRRTAPARRSTGSGASSCRACASASDSSAPITAARARACRGTQDSSPEGGRS